jgi:hypothetical protein
VRDELPSVDRGVSFRVEARFLCLIRFNVED